VISRIGGWILGLLLLTAALRAAAENFRDPWSLFLQKYVSADGRVDYGAWKASDTDVGKMKGILYALGAAKHETGPREEALAHYLNLYNVFMIKLVLDHYPVSSVKKIGGGFGPWKMTFSPRRGEKISLDEIEHKILRVKFKEPRIHFALVCASVGCPPLRTEAYRGYLIDTQLAEQERRFLTDTSKNRWRIVESGFLSKEARLQFELSSIFKWFGEDFGGEAGVIRRIYPYLDRESQALVDQSRYDVEYLDYDWSLNGK